MNEIVSTSTAEILALPEETGRVTAAWRRDWDAKFAHIPLPEGVIDDCGWDYDDDDPDSSFRVLCLKRWETPLGTLEISATQSSDGLIKEHHFWWFGSENWEVDAEAIEDAVAALVAGASERFAYPAAPQ